MSKSTTTLGRRASRRRRSIPEAQVASAPSPLRLAIFPTGPWRMDILFAHGGTQERFVQYANEKYPGDETDDPIVPSPRAKGVTWNCTDRKGAKANGLFIWVQDATEVDVVVHELFHAVAQILRYRGVPLGSDSEEAYAYLLDNLIERIIHCRKWLVVK